MKVLGIIPARGGSKGIKRKNIREIHGKPLIAYSIELGKQCEDLMDVVVSTDDDEIETISKHFGANVIKRPKNLATDDSDISSAITHVINELEEKENKAYDVILLLQPTAPLRTRGDIFNVINLFKEDVNLQAVISVVKIVDNHPARMYKLDQVENMVPYSKGQEKVRRQDLEPLYIRNGCIYAVKTSSFKNNGTLMPVNKKAYVMNHRWAVNIDEEIDLDLFEIVLHKWKAHYENTNS